MAKSLFLALLLAGFPAAAEWKPPTAADWAMLGLQLGLSYGDALLTADFQNHYHWEAADKAYSARDVCHGFESRNCQRVYDMREANPAVRWLLGPQPTIAGVLALTTGISAVEAAVWYWDPGDVPRWLITGIGSSIELSMVVHNVACGASIRF